MEIAELEAWGVWSFVVFRVGTDLRRSVKLFIKDESHLCQGVGVTKRKSECLQEIWGDEGSGRNVWKVTIL